MKQKHPFDNLILRNMLGPLIAAMQLFLLYVVAHGHYGPGGAFQGGTLLACSMILPLLANSKGRWFLVIGKHGAAAMAATGVAIFAGVGAVSLLFGQPFLDYAALPLGGMAAPDKRSLGILLIEVGVTLAVAGGLVSIYYSLNRDIRNDEEKRNEKVSPETGDFE